MKKMNKKGFTLIEMLVVIAIIAILVAIVIPVVSSATEKAKEAKDAANIRSAIAEVTTAALSAGKAENGSAATVKPVKVKLTQTGAFNQNADLTEVGGYDIADFENATEVEVSWDATNMKVVVKVGQTTLTPKAQKAG